MDKDEAVKFLTDNGKQGDAVAFLALLKEHQILQERFDHMKQEYRRTQQELKELRQMVHTVRTSFDGHRGTELWEEDVMPSKEWFWKFNALGRMVHPLYIRELKKSVVSKKSSSGYCNLSLDLL